MKHMTIYAQALRVKGNTEKRIAQAIASGFTGQLRLWRDNLLSTENHNGIFNYTS